MSVKSSATYECRVRNAQGIASRTTRVVVLVAPVVALFQKNHAVSSTIGAAIDSRLVINCVVSAGQPAPSIRWETRRGRSISRNDRVRAVHSSSLRSQLIIDDLTVADARTYTCVAENEAGTARVDVQVVAEAGDDAFNFSLPDLDAAESPPDEAEAETYGDDLEEMEWVTTDDAGRLTHFDVPVDWTAPDDGEDLVSDAHTDECENISATNRNRQSRAVLEEDDRTEVDDTLEYPWKATGIIFFTSHTDSVDQRSCTGTLINRRHVLTAAHCISDGNGRFYLNITFSPAANGKASNPWPYGTYKWEKLMTVTGYHYRRQSGYDYGLIVLDKEVGDFYMPFMKGVFVLQQTSPPVLSINQYPVDKNRDGLPVMVQTYCPVGRPVYRHQLVSHTCDTAGGASGSGMYSRYRAKDGKQAIALVHTGRLFDGGNRAVVINKAKYLQLCYWIESTGGRMEKGCKGARTGTKRNEEVVAGREKRTANVDSGVSLIWLQ